MLNSRKELEYTVNLEMAGNTNKVHSIYPLGKWEFIFL